MASACDKYRRMDMKKYRNGISLLAIASFLFAPLVTFAGVSTVLNSTCREATGYLTNAEDLRTVQFNDEYLGLQYVDHSTAGNVCNRGALLFDTARQNNTVTSIKIDWELDTLRGVDTCNLYNARTESGSGGGAFNPVNDLYMVSEYNTLISTTTDVSRRTTIVTNSITNGQFTFAFGGGSGIQGCRWKIYSLRDQNDVDIMRNVVLAPIGTSGGGGASVDLSPLLTSINEGNEKISVTISVIAFTLMFVGMLVAVIMFKRK